jgi:hypothetical protein
MEHNPAVTTKTFVVGSGNCHRSWTALAAYTNIHRYIILVHYGSPKPLMLVAL